MENSNKKTLTTSAAIAVLLAGIGIFYYFSIFLPKSSQVDVVDATLKCNQLYDLKKAKYWDNEIGQSKAIYNKDLNTCLALNIYNNFDTNEYFGMVIDMGNDKTLVYYNSTPKGFYFEGENGDKKITCEFSYDYLEYIKNGKEVKEYGCGKHDLLDKMFEQIRGFGFSVFDGLKSD